METIFWISLIGIMYAYFLYPVVLYLIGRFFPVGIIVSDHDYTPSTSIIMPVHNEANVISAKLTNLDQLDYPRDNLKVIVVADNCTDNTVDIIRKYSSSLNIQIVELSERRGKAHALNAGLRHVETELVIFSDASILLNTNALLQIVKPFQDNSIGCVSGEDHIADGGGEGLYGQYELFLRNKESSIGSIVGASGSFYAERSAICHSFEPGLAPDFLSVLNTVKQGYRAITEPKAIGHMTSVKNTRDEFPRKVRTLLRGMTALFDKSELLNPFKYNLFSFSLISHKLMRWLVPFFLLAVFISNSFLLNLSFYKIIMLLQIMFYLSAALAFYKFRYFDNSIIGKIPLFFIMVNVAIAAAWFRYLRGDRQELWSPSQRSEIGK